MMFSSVLLPRSAPGHADPADDPADGHPVEAGGPGPEVSRVHTGLLRLSLQAPFAPAALPAVLGRGWGPELQSGTGQAREAACVGRISVEGFLSSLQDDPLWLPLHRRQDGADRGGDALGHHRQHPAQQEQHGGHGCLQQGRPAQLAQVQEPGVRGSPLLSLPCCFPCSSAQLQAVPQGLCCPACTPRCPWGHPLTPLTHRVPAAQFGEAGWESCPQTALQQSRGASLPPPAAKTALPRGTAGGCSKILSHSCCPV